MAIKKIPKMEKLPVQNTHSVMTKFYHLKVIADKDMDEHQKNYVVIMLVTVIEQFFRSIVEMRLKDGTIKVPEKVELDTRIIDEVASSMSKSPKRTIRNLIISLTYLFQSTKAITDTFGPRAIEDTERENLDKLFKHRHSLVHSVDQPVLLSKEIRKHYDIAEQLMGRVLDDQDHADLSHYIVKGQSLQELGDVDGSKKCFRMALDRFRDAVKSDPDNPDSHFGVGLAQEYLDDHEAAIRSFDEAIKLKPDIAEVHLHKGRLLFTLERYEEAAKSLAVEIAADPNNTSALLLAGSALGAVGARETALALLDRAISNEPGNVVAYSEKEEILRSLGLHEWADECHKQFSRRMHDLAFNHIALMIEQGKLGSQSPNKADGDSGDSGTNGEASNTAKGSAP